MLLLLLLLLLGLGGGAGRLVRAKGNDDALGEVEFLARGFSKVVEGVEEGLDKLWRAGFEQRGGVIRILHCWDAGAPNRNAQIRVGEEPAGQRPAHEEVHGGGQGTALPHTPLPEHGVRDVAIDHCCGPGVSEQGFSPVQHTLTCSHCLHDPKEKGSGDCVISFAEI